MAAARLYGPTLPDRIALCSISIRSKCLRTIRGHNIVDGVPSRVPYVRGEQQRMVSAEIDACWETLEILPIIMRVRARTCHPYITYMYVKSTAAALKNVQNLGASADDQLALMKMCCRQPPCLARCSRAIPC